MKKQTLISETGEILTTKFSQGESDKDMLILITYPSQTGVDSEDIWGFFIGTSIEECVAFLEVSEIQIYRAYPVQRDMRVTMEIEKQRKWLRE